MLITEPRGGEGSAVCARGGDTSSRRWLQSWPSTSTTVSHGDRGRPGQGGEREKNHTATLRKMLPPPRRLVPSTLRWMPGKTLGRHQPPGGQHRCLRCCGRSGYSSAPRSISSTLCLCPVALRRCAAGGRTAGGLSHTSRLPCSRARYRSAQDRVSTLRCSHSPWCAADGGTAGGSAYDRVSYRCHQAACRAAR